MPRIKIEDLPVLQDLSAQEKKGLFGGLLLPAVQQAREPASTDDSSTTTQHDESDLEFLSERA